MAETILNLTTLADRPLVNIKSKKFPAGKPYELRNLADLGPAEYGVILHHDAEVKKLRVLKKLTPAQDQQIVKYLDDIVKLIVLGIEPAVLAALTGEQKEMLVVTWTIQIQGAAEGNARPNRKARRTTAPSYRASKSSTAATRKPGSTRRRAS